MEKARPPRVKSILHYNMNWFGVGVIAPKEIINKKREKPAAMSAFFVLVANILLILHHIIGFGYGKQRYGAAPHGQFARHPH